MSKFSKKLISPIVPPANTAGVYSAVEQLQNLNALAITAINFCADSSGTDGGLGDDTAISTAGGFVKLTGSGFTSASIVYINGISVTKYYLSNTTIVATVPAAVAGTTASLIVFNGSTVGSIWAAGISYSGFPSWTTTAASNLGVVVSTQLVAVGDAPLVYTFVSGTLPPNCTISSSGLLSGTVTGVSTNAIYTFTVAVTDAQNQNVSQSIVYTLVVSDFYYRYTSLHISGDSNPTWITDASTNALAVTTTGSPQATIFSPVKEGYYGNSFNGSSDWLSIPTNSTGLALGSGDFTIEAWVYKNTSGSGTIFGKTAGINYAIDCYISNNSNYPMMTLSSNGTATTVITGGTVIASNRWYHAAYVRSGTTINIYINGVLDGTGAFSGAVFNAGDITVSGIGARPAGGAPDSWLNGYISNLRIVKGTAVYTANFTPSATPLTAITNTVLLTCQSARFIDNSAVPVTITAAGTPKVVSSNPFNLPSGLAAYGAGYFDGSSYVKAADSTAFDLSSGDWTIEAWYYLTATPGANGFTIVSNCNSNTGAGGWGLMVASLNQIYLQGNANSQGYISFTSVLNTWNHVAVIRSGTGAGSSSIYVNGVKYTPAGNGAGNPTFASTNVGPYMGYGQVANSYATGYISNVRVVKGTSIYGANPASITVPTAPLTAVSGTSLLTLQTNVPHNNSQFRDTSTNNALVTRNGNTTQGSFSPFTKQYPYSTATVGGSAYFDGTGDYLSMPVPAVGAGNFTAELFVYLNAVSIDEHFFQSNSATNSNWLLSLDSTTNKFRFAVRNDAGVNNADIYSSVTAIVGQWYHIAGVVNGTTATLYVNGIALASATLSGTRSGATGTTVYIGQNGPTTDRNLNGYLSNARLTLGTAVYTANFTPSTTPLTAIPGTVLLMPFTNAAVYDNTMLNNFETVGNVQVNTSTLKYGTGALKFNGTTDYLTIPASANTSFGTGNFTVEFWINTAGANSQILSLASGTAAGNWQVTLYNGNFYWQSARNTTDALYVASASITNSQWHHVAITRTSNTLRIFFDGAQQGSVTDSTNYNVTSVLNIGYSTTYFNGYIDELRITKGFARYTATFTPSSGAFSVSAPFGTSILPSKSLRFRASASAYLSRTPAVASGTRTAWTYSAWVKLGGFTSALLLNDLIQTGTGSTNYMSIGFANGSTADQLAIRIDGYYKYWTNAVFRDPAAWYHITVAFNSNEATGNRIKIYVNGVRQTTVVNSEVTLGYTSAFGVTTNPIYIGRSSADSGFTSWYYSAYNLAEVNFVDGLALEPTMFGAYSTYGQWLPISYAGYQGANGFYLPFNVGTDTSSVSISYLAVAGGGGGGTGQSASTVGNGGGGGAGGLLTGTTSLVINNVYPIVIGAGGNAGTPGVNSGSGANSTAFGITAIGGGAGGSYSGNNGQTGGSGGGAGYGGTAGAGTSGQGYAGGAGYTGGTPYQAGGGGGAGAVGTNGPGGVGVQSSITGSSTYYAGGGAGGNGSNVTASSGGSGGGGTGGYGTTAGTAGTANLGGGGGGGGNQGTGGTTSSNGAAGGSGVVIISYSGTQKFYGGTVTSSGGNTIHTFTSSSALTSIFADQSGNGNTWTANNINVSTPGPTYDLLTDVPTLTSATAANYAVLNPLEVYGMTLTDGNLKATAGTTAHYNARSTIYMPSSGKWYFEGQATSVSNPGQMSLGLVNSSIAVSTQAYAAGYYSIYFGFSGATTNLYINNNGTSSSANSISAAISDITQVAYDATTGKLWLGYNNSWKNSSGATDATANPGTGTNPTMTISTAISLSPFIHFYSNSGTINFGQQPFTYTPPANFLALNTYNI